VWDLQRNGGSVQATTERLLGGGGLEVVSLGFYNLGEDVRKKGCPRLWMRVQEGSKRGKGGCLCANYGLVASTVVPASSTALDGVYAFYVARKQTDAPGSDNEIQPCVEDRRAVGGQGWGGSDGAIVE